MRYWTECSEFFGQFREQYRNTGSILPSGRCLARALIRPLKHAHPPRCILEVGPGTGAVTAELVKALRPGDRLDIVEINAKFVALLERRFANEPNFRRCSERCRIIHSPLQEVPGEGLYDFIVSGLPLNNFPLGLVREVFECYRRLLKPGGTLSYFEYLAIRDLKMPLVPHPERRRLKVLTNFLGRRIARHQVAEEQVFLNVPPAVARHLVFS